MSDYPPLPPKYHFAEGSSIYPNDVDVFDEKGALQEWYNFREKQINSARRVNMEIPVTNKEEAIALLSTRFLLGMNEP